MLSKDITVNVKVRRRRAFYVVVGLMSLFVTAAQWLSRLLPKLVKVEIVK